MLLGEQGRGRVHVSFCTRVPGRVQHTHTACIGAQTRGLSAKLLNPRKWSQGASSGWGPVLGILCVYVSWTVCPCVCVCRRGWGRAFFLSPGRLLKAELVIHQPHPPLLGPAWPELQERSFLEKCVCVGIETTRARADFAGFPRGAPWECV